MGDPHPRLHQRADEPARRQGKRVHGKADEAYGNHRIPAWTEGKRIQALIPHIGSKKKCQKSLNSALQAVRAHRNEKTAAGGQ